MHSRRTPTLAENVRENNVVIFVSKTFPTLHSQKVNYIIIQLQFQCCAVNLVKNAKLATKGCSEAFEKEAYTYRQYSRKCYCSNCFPDVSMAQSLLSEKRNENTKLASEVS